MQGAGCRVQGEGCRVQGAGRVNAYSLSIRVPSLPLLFQIRRTPLRERGRERERESESERARKTERETETLEHSRAVKSTPLHSGFGLKPLGLVFEVLKALGLVFEVLKALGLVFEV